MSRIGIISNMVRKELKNDFWGILQSLADMGYQGIEMLPQLLQGDSQENVRRFLDLGLCVVSHGAQYEKLLKELDQVISEAHQLHSDQIFLSIAPGRTEEEIMREIDCYNSIGAKLKREGLKLVYHNHDHEFKMVFHGVTAYDMILDRTDPEYVFFELDIGWMSHAGQDPEAMIRRLKQRLTGLHLKDFSSFHDKSHFTSIGTGIVKIRAAVREAMACELDWLIVEQDQLNYLSTQETVLASILFLKEIINS